MTQSSPPHYPPFGSSLPNRAWSDGNRGYRFGYQGSECNIDVASDIYATYFRILDCRLARWLSKDPVYDVSISSFASMDNNPVFFNDPNGDDVIYGGKGLNKFSNKLKTTLSRIFDRGFRQNFRGWKNSMQRFNIIQDNDHSYDNTTLTDYGNGNAVPIPNQNNNANYIRYGRAFRHKSKIANVTYFSDVMVSSELTKETIVDNRDGTKTVDRSWSITVKTNIPLAYRQGVASVSIRGDNYGVNNTVSYTGNGTFLGENAPGIYIPGTRKPRQQYGRTILVLFDGNGDGSEDGVGHFSYNSQNVINNNTSESVYSGFILSARMTMNTVQLKVERGFWGYKWKKAILLTPTTFIPPGTVTISNPVFRTYRK